MEYKQNEETGVFAVGPNLTLQMSYNKLLGSSPNALDTTRIIIILGAIGVITNKEVNRNICDILILMGSTGLIKFSHLELLLIVLLKVP